MSTTQWAIRHHDGCITDHGTNEKAARAELPSPGRTLMTRNDPTEPWVPAGPTTPPAKSHDTNAEIERDQYAEQLARCPLDRPGHLCCDCDPVTELAAARTEIERLQAALANANIHWGRVSDIAFDERDEARADLNRLRDTTVPAHTLKNLIDEFEYVDRTNQERNHTGPDPFTYEPTPSITRLRALLPTGGGADTTSPDGTGEGTPDELHPCGHPTRTQGCDGCDPGAIEFALAANLADPAPPADMIPATALLGALSDIAARRREFKQIDADDKYLTGLDDAYGLVNNRLAAARTAPTTKGATS